MLADATVTFAEGILQVRSPVSYTNDKGKAIEARDRVFKFKGEPHELKDWLYQLTATKNQLLDRSLLRPVTVKEGELLIAFNNCESTAEGLQELVAQYQAAIDKASSQVSSASKESLGAHFEKVQQFESQLKSRDFGVRRRAPAPPSGQSEKVGAEVQSSSDGEVHKTEEATEGLAEALAADDGSSKLEGEASQIAIKEKVEEKEAVVKSTAERDETSDYMDMAAELDQVIDDTATNSKMQGFSMPPTPAESMLSERDSKTNEIDDEKPDVEDDEPKPSEPERDIFASVAEIPEFDDAPASDAAKKNAESESWAEAEKDAEAERAAAVAETKAKAEEEEAENAKKRAEENETKAKAEEEEAARARAEEEAKVKADGEVALKAKVEEEEEAAAAARAQEEADSKAKIEEESAAAEAKADEELAAAARALEEAEKAKVEEEKAVATRAQEEADSKVNADEEAKVRADEEAAAKAKADDEAADALKEEEIVATCEGQVDGQAQASASAESTAPVKAMKESADSESKSESALPASELPFCDECGLKAKAMSKFCKQCGTPLKPVSEPATDRAPSPRGDDKAAKKKAAARKLIEQRAAKKSPNSSPRGERKAEPELSKVLAGAKVNCSGCGEENKASSKSCASCGKPQ